MSSDDLTQNQAPGDQDANTTQPTITAVFRLLSEVRDGQIVLNSRLVELEKRPDAHSARFDELDRRLDAHSARFDELDRRLDAHSARFDELDRRLDAHSARFDELDRRLDAHSARFDELEKRLDSRFAEMSEQMKVGFQNLADKIERSRLHSEADYHDLLRRIRELETKAS